MTDEYTDAVVAVRQSHDEEYALRLRDWTPPGGYTALVESALDADVDLTDLSDGEAVGRATVTADGEVTHFTTEVDCDHSDTRRLGTHPDADRTWPVVFEDEPKAGLAQRTRCMDCGETVDVYYRIEEIISDETVHWSRSEN